jgi:hypothetical protein
MAQVVIPEAVSMKRHQLLVSFSLFFVIASSTSAQVIQPDLDLRFLPRPAEPTGPVGVGPSIQTNYPSPVDVSLLSVSTTACERDEEVVYDVELRNRSSTTIMLPWTLIPPEVPPSSTAASTYLGLRLFLQIDEPLGGFLGHGYALHGNPVQAAVTLRAVPPGGAVVLRASTPCLPLNSRANVALAKGEAVNLKVAAAVYVLRKPSEVGAHVVSKPVELTVTRTPLN